MAAAVIIQDVNQCPRAFGDGMQFLIGLALLGLGVMIFFSLGFFGIILGLFVGGLGLSLMGGK